VPDDRFADLGPGGRGREESPPSDEQRRERAGDRLAELDRTEPEPDQSRPAGPPPPARRYTWVVGVVAAVVIVLFAINSLGDDGDALRGLPRGTMLPAFAAPSASGRLDGDANVRQGMGGTDRAGRRPACEVRGPDVVNMCELRRRPTVVTLLTTRGTGEKCVRQLGPMERVRRDFPHVSFVAVVSGQDREDVARLVRQHRLGYPVAVDPDGAVITVYRVGVCPTTSFAAAGGDVRASKLGLLDERALRAQVRALLRSERR
jgi:hypothetical protein